MAFNKFLAFSYDDSCAAFLLLHLKSQIFPFHKYFFNLKDCSSRDSRDFSRDTVSRRVIDKLEYLSTNDIWVSYTSRDVCVSGSENGRFEGIAYPECSHLNNTQRNFSCLTHYR